MNQTRPLRGRILGIRQPLNVAMVMSLGAFGLYFSRFSVDISDYSGLRFVAEQVQHEENRYMMQNGTYIPAKIERYVMDNLVQLGYDTQGEQNAPGCTIWKDESATPVYHELHQFLRELEEYTVRLRNFTAKPDLRTLLDQKDTCKSLELDEQGLGGIFKSGQLSLTSSGYVEPLLPPMRHPSFCFKGNRLMDLGYVVHDFGAMCRKLKKTSRTVFIDMGASLEFHSDSTMPAVYVVELFRQFGFHFDHIYAFEITQIPPARVFEKIPPHLMASYHWINVGVDADPESKLNPLKTILGSFNKDDFIVVKLDIDTSSIETALARQILNDDRYSGLIDQFYFEHHVHLQELAGSWGGSMDGSVKESLELFYHLREKGVPAHFWV